FGCLMGVSIISRSNGDKRLTIIEEMAGGVNRLGGAKGKRKLAKKGRRIHRGTRRRFACFVILLFPQP
ncbi:MAG: hypothetical protein RR865_12060, partial [Clostridia bacterium]